MEITETEHNYIPTRFWAHGWHNVNFKLYAQICAIAKKPTKEESGLNMDESLLSDYLTNNHRNEKIETIIIVPN